MPSTTTKPAKGKHKFYGPDAIIEAVDLIADENNLRGSARDTRSKVICYAMLLYLRRADMMARLRKAGFKKIDQIKGPTKR